MLRVELQVELLHDPLQVLLVGVILILRAPELQELVQDVLGDRLLLELTGDDEGLEVLDELQPHVALGEQLKHLRKQKA